MISQALNAMLFGMLGIFLVMGLIILSIFFINFLGKRLGRLHDKLCEKFPRIFKKMKSE